MNRALPYVLLAALCFSAGFVHGQAATARSIAELLSQPEPGRTAQLDGRITGKKNAAVWIFQDVTGTLLVDMDKNVASRVTREMKKGGAMQVNGALFRRLGSREWELRATEVQGLKSGLPKFAVPAPAPSADARSRVNQDQAAPDPMVRSGRKPFFLPRLFRRSGASTDASSNAAIKAGPNAAGAASGQTATTKAVANAAPTIADVLRAPNAGPVALSGTVMEVMSRQRILLWDGTAAMAVRLDRLGRVPELRRAQRVSVRGTLVREGAALVELQATEIR